MGEWRTMDPATLARDHAMVALLIELGANPNVRNYGGLDRDNQYGPLYWPALALGVCSKGTPVVHLAVGLGGLEVLEAPSGDIQTPLCRAEAGNRKAIALLLRHGADVNAINGSGQTPLDYCTGVAAQWGDTPQVHLPVAKMLLEHRARHAPR